MSEREDELVERVAEAIRVNMDAMREAVLDDPLSAPTQNEWRRRLARATIAAMREAEGDGLDENWVVTELYRCADVDPGVFYARVTEAGGGDKRFGDGIGDTVGDAIRAAVAAALAGERDDDDDDRRGWR